MRCSCLLDLFARTLSSRNLLTHDFPTYNLVRLDALLAFDSNESHTLAFLQRFEPVTLWIH